MGFTGQGVWQAQFHGVQQQARADVDHLVRGVEFVAQDGVAERLQVYPELV